MKNYFIGNMIYNNIHKMERGSDIKVKEFIKHS